jgi:putative peptidoglycan lipid II flippase
LAFRVLFVTVSCLSVLGILFSPQLVGLYAGAFREIPGKFEMTVELTRIMFPFFPLVALAAAFMGILNACGVFFLPAFASALFNLVSISVGVLFAMIFFQKGPEWGVQPIAGMAIGVVAGAAVQAFCQLPQLIKKGYRWSPREASDPVWYQDPRLKQMLWMMVPGTIGLAATQLNLLVNTILATSQGPSAVSWLGYAFRLMQFPIGIFGVSLAAATLPRVSALWTRRDHEGVQKVLEQSLKQVFAINLPAAAGLAFLGYPIVQLIYNYGRFYPVDVQNTAMALAMYAVGLPAYSAVKVLVPACYALGNTRVPVLSSVAAVVFTLVLNLSMVGPFGFWGLALGTSLAAVLNALLLLFSVKKLLEAQGGRFSLGGLGRSFFLQTAGALVMGGICYWSGMFLASVLPDSLMLETVGRKGLPFIRLLRVGLLVLEGVGVVVIFSRIFRLQETTEIVDIFTKKIKKKLSRNAT